MIALAEPLSSAEADALEEFRFAEGLGYALPRRHVIHRWTWEETQRFVKQRDERREEYRKNSHVIDVLKAVRRGEMKLASAIGYIEKVWPDPEPTDVRLEEAFPESRERKGDD